MKSYRWSGFGNGAVMGMPKSKENKIFVGQSKSGTEQV